METKKLKTTFKDYFNSLEEPEKIRIRECMVPQYIAYSTFYYKVDQEKFSELELEKLETITGKTFTR